MLLTVWVHVYSLYQQASDTVKIREIMNYARFSTRDLLASSVNVGDRVQKNSFLLSISHVAEILPCFSLVSLILVTVSTDILVPLRHASNGAYNERMLQVPSMISTKGTNNSWSVRIKSNNHVSKEPSGSKPTIRSDFQLHWWRHRQCLENQWPW